MHITEWQSGFTENILQASYSWKVPDVRWWESKHFDEYHQLVQSNIFFFYLTDKAILFMVEHMHENEYVALNWIRSNLIVFCFIIS